MTEQQFRRKLIVRAAASALLFVPGLLLLLYVINRRGILIPYAFKGKFTCGFISGITGAGVAAFIINFIILKIPKYFKKRYIAENDERNRQISLKARAWAGYFSIYAILVSTLFLPEQVIKYVLCLMCVPLVVYMIIYTILQIKM